MTVVPPEAVLGNPQGCFEFHLTAKRRPLEFSVWAKEEIR